MADDAGGGFSLKKTFNSIVKHMFSPTMIIMMVLMALPAVAAAAPAGAATLGDIGKATLDMFGHMIAAPFTDGGVAFDAIGNAFQGDFGASSYDWGMMDHGGHAVSHAAADPGIIPGSEHAHSGAGISSAPSPEQVAEYEADADFWGVDSKEHANLMMSHE